jgi:hypothetical protein
MSLLTLPIDLLQRAIDDLATIAGGARELPARIQELDERAARMQDQLDRALALGEVIAANTAAMVEMAERVESRGASMIELGERMMALGNSVTEQSESIARALAIASPLEGTVERLGRALDRLPGGSKPRPASESERPGSM